MTPFERLHPALQHHIVNSLGWKTLRPIQEQAIEPLLAREHALVLGPTAGGKTEAVVFPLLSRMLAEGWQGLGLLYVCPIRALLNNLEPRLAHYTGLLGRRVERWHGDIGESIRRQVRQDPPDLLLTTPESLEVLLVSRRTDRQAFFGRVQAIVVDELHAFAGDDRGWHLLSVLERVRRLAGGEPQRMGLSATIGNPAALLDWLAGACEGPRRVIQSQGSGAAPAEVGVDFVGGLGNAATIIARLHRGEKRLVFLDSRARVEELAADLRTAGVATFVSHSSLGVEERRRAEAAFAEGSDCVIVATSTLELGIDVGDLDRVIQVDAPTTVSGFLQRLGRTGRRAGTPRNCLFLATSDDALLRACGLVSLWTAGYVEPVIPPPQPLHVLAQQWLALALQQSGIGRSQWPAWIGRMPGFAGIEKTIVTTLLDHMIDAGILVDEAGILSVGPEGERSLGYRNFLELYSVFTTPPLFRVLHWQTELGHVHEVSFELKHDDTPVLLLGGRSWRVTHVDWQRRLAHVEPAEARGRSLWLGGGGLLHLELCRAIRHVLVTGTSSGTLWSRARERLGRLGEEFAWLDEHGTLIVRDGDGERQWWTFAGRRANTALRAGLGDLARPGREADNLAIPLHPDADPEAVHARLVALDPATIADLVPISEQAIEGLKFNICLPHELAAGMLRRRMADPRAIEVVTGEPIRGIRADYGA